MTSTMNMESALNENDPLLNDKKHIVSMRLNNADRSAVRSTAARLFVRESELYRFAVYHLMHRLHKLHDESCTGSDLLPLFLEFKEELNQHLNLKKHQLFKIFNGKNTSPDKLLQINEAATYKQANTTAWLECYLLKKYLVKDEFDEVPDSD